MSCMGQTCVSLCICLLFLALSHSCVRLVPSFIRPSGKSLYVRGNFAEVGGNFNNAGVAMSLVGQNVYELVLTLSTSSWNPGSAWPYNCFKYSGVQTGWDNNMNFGRAPTDTAVGKSGSLVGYYYWCFAGLLFLVLMRSLRVRTCTTQPHMLKVMLFFLTIRDPHYCCKSVPHIDWYIT